VIRLPHSAIRRDTTGECIEAGYMDIIDKLQTEGAPPKAALTRSHPLATLIAKKLSTTAPGASPPPAPILQVVPKAYEDGFLRKPREGERACVHGDECEGVLMGAFAPVEFLLPDEAPGEPKQCLLCLRKGVMYHHYNMSARDSFESIIQPHRNIVNVPGEYRADCCIRPRADRFCGITDPLMTHQRHHYVVEGDTLRQINVNFRRAPASASSTRSGMRTRSWGK
jgi:hypothetical protein